MRKRNTSKVPRSGRESSNQEPKKKKNLLNPYSLHMMDVRYDALALHQDVASSLILSTRSYGVVYFFWMTRQLRAFQISPVTKISKLVVAFLCSGCACSTLSHHS